MELLLKYKKISRVEVKREVIKMFGLVGILSFEKRMN